MRLLLRSKLIHSLLGISVTVILCIWLYLIIDWQVVGVEISDVNHFIFFPVISVFALQLWIRGLRWRYLLPKPAAPLEQRVKLTTLFEGVVLGNFTNYILPLRAGEFLRPYLIAKESTQSYSACFVSVVLERFFDLTFVLIAFGLMLRFHKAFDAWIYQGAYIFGVVALLILGFIVASGFTPALVSRISRRILSPLPDSVSGKIDKLVEDLITGARVLRSFPNLILLCILTTAVWLVTFFQFQLLLYYFGLYHSFEFAAAIGVIVALAVATPSAPGFIGVLQAACIAAFALYGIDEETALTYAIVFHVYQYVFIVAYGLIVVTRHGLRFRDLVLIHHNSPLK